MKLRHVSKTFPGVKALDDVHFDIYPGEVHSLVGENGAGKSTFIKIVAGEYEPDKGSEIMINGEVVQINGIKDSMDHGIAVIYQDISLFGNLTVAENIVINQILYAGKKRMDWKWAREKAQKALDVLGSDIDPMETLENLSVARQQIVAIAGAIAQDAKLIIMDEPTSTLSRSEIDNLYKIVDDLTAKNIAIIFISHKMDELFRLSDRFTVLRDGQYIATLDAKKTTESQLVSLMVGREINIINYSDGEVSDEVVLKVQGLSKKGNYKDINFDLRKGEVLGITGLVGAGRTEMVETLFGIRSRDEGVIELRGEPIEIRSTTEALEHSIAYIPEDRKSDGLVLSKTLEENITLPVLGKYANKLKIINQTKAKANVQLLMDKLDVRPNNSQLLGRNLSGGNQQKVVIAKWLGTDSNIIIFDEPTNGVDIGAKSEIYEIIRELAAEGKSIILVSSELAEVLSVCDRILVMRRGRISGRFFNKDLTQEMLMEKAVSR